ncbi:undecaprenyldiphospho-muramoylpentapeptide beta-N-acetylglucosaminyltransferase [Anaerotalea alkaliphila]|uniref:UDP-N-acetylglucosamine--N-acetylmuramyl-(pentapeptide) pyrophosphoryl-undecaprenol N-acetylglucosamine transferase n=1 Tax=Anaerotalea alkaliphila TaxID=2662126 RepID=A0A7X5KLX9_9FIRM|nr:undecaprenyldiphospho-muramoylpentapeptide beta-N-acetylglucosaminyltransferase [Anaerotalea alkaliphila]NDL66389.1 undecaprenyldiphospho-muramoylpentapeptide beta-N-acetylglucosaminyltransferase [Anaerotalea alkaliphila]
MKKIVLTGGGTAGHVTPNFALLEGLAEAGYEIHYIGSRNGIEKELVRQQHLPYHPISSGKLRRYKDLKNLTDPFKVLLGCVQAWKVLGRIRPAVVFSKGGFVAVPVVLGAWLRRIPVVVHESDMTPGLANRLSQPFAKAVCTTFPQTLEHLPKTKGVHTGSPIRKSLYQGDAGRGREFTGLTARRPVLLMMGGSIGSVKVNQVLRALLPTLLEEFHVLHLCGKGNLDDKLEGTPGYRQYEFIGKELPDLLAMADLVLSRAGSNAISEFLALKKPALLVPLSAGASRGDQILNARAFQRDGYAHLLQEEELTQETLLEAIRQLWTDRDACIRAMEGAPHTDGTEKVLETIKEYSR